MPRSVRKRDGREVPFDARKIEAAIFKAMAAVGEEDASLAAEVATVVSMTLASRYDAPLREGEGARGIPDIEEIQDLVERALIELGRASVAKAYILYRDRRARAREALQVHASRERPGPRGARVEVEERERASPWSKGRIVAALIREAELTRELAERVAARVEEKVFAAGWKRVTTGLIRELVDNELVELGLASALARQISFGLPLFDLRAIVHAPEPALDPLRAADGEILVERASDARIAGEVLRRFALHEVLGEASARAHLAGDLHVVDLARPHQPLVCYVPARALVARAPDAVEATELIGSLAEIARACAHDVVLGEAAGLVTALARDGRGDARLESWLRAIAATARASGRRIDLSAVTERGKGGPVVQRLVEALAEIDSDPFAPRLYLDEEEFESLLADRSSAAALEPKLEALLAAHRVVIAFGAHGERFVAPGCHRFGDEPWALACGGAVALNLPRAALRAGPWREDRMLEACADLARASIEALAELRDFQQRAGAARALPLRCRTAYAVAPVGLREALQSLGDGEIRPDQGARIVGLLGEALRRFGEPQHLSVALSPFFGERARERFAAMDASLPQRAQRLLWGEPSDGAEPGAPYGAGYRLSPVPGREPWECEAELLSTVAAGALHPFPGERSPAGALALAFTWRRFRELRGAPGRESTPGARRDVADLYATAESERSAPSP
jgi:hypothetical protein